MKVTLSDPPDGYEAEADFVWDRLRIDAHVLTNQDDGPFIVAQQFGARTHIILTPKKRKYWRLDPVDTFDEATKHPKNPKWALVDAGNGETHYRQFEFAPDPNSKWVRRTECEE